VETNFARKALNHSLPLCLGIVCSPTPTKQAFEILTVLVRRVFFFQLCVKRASVGYGHRGTITAEIPLRKQFDLVVIGMARD